jgi:hypothetical protein
MKRELGTAFEGSATANGAVARRRRVAVSVAVLAAALFITLGSVRWLFTTNLLAGHHSEYHALRVLLVADLWQHGALIPRWVPELAGGLGYPLFIYYAWLSYAFAAELHVLGLPPVAAMNAVVVAAALSQALGAWKLGREVGGRSGGMVAWVLFALAPYQLANLYVRGNFPEFVAGSFAPWALWAMLRFVVGKGRGYLVVCAALVATILLCHNITGLTVGGTVTLVGLLFAGTLPSGNRRAGARRAVLAALSGVALSAFFWLPIVAARHDVGLANDFNGYLDYRQHFLYLHQLVATGWGYGFSVAGPNDTMPLQIGLAQVVSVLLLAPLAIAVARRGLRRRPLRLGGLTLIAALLAFLTTLYAAPLWSMVTPLATLQFPWRLHLPGTLVIATAVAFATRVLLVSCGRRRLGAAAVLVAGGALALGAFSLGHAKPQATYVCDESCLRKLLGLGYFTTSIQDEFRPIWAQDLPALASIMRAGQATLDDVPLREVQLPSHERRGDFTVHLDVPRSGELRLPMFWFPGWSITTGATTLTTYPCPGTGIVCSKIAAGSHELAVAWRPTLVYWLGSAMSLATLIALGVWSWSSRRGERNHAAT